MTSLSSQVDKGAAETGVKGFAGRPLRPRLPHLQVAWHPHGGHGGNHLAEDAGPELADLCWSVTLPERLLLEKKNLLNVWSIVELFESLKLQYYFAL